MLVQLKPAYNLPYTINKTSKIKEDLKRLHYFTNQRDVDLAVLALVTLGICTTGV